MLHKLISFIVEDEDAISILKGFHLDNAPGKLPLHWASVDKTLQIQGSQKDNEYGRPHFEMVFQKH